MWKCNCTHCANWHFSSHCSDEAQFTPSGHLLSPDSRQGRQAGPVGICKTHILSMCTAILSEFTKPTLVRRQDAEIAYAIQENFEYCTIWINSIVSCFNSLIYWTTIMNMYKTYWPLMIHKWSLFVSRFGKDRAHVSQNLHKWLTFHTFIFLQMQSSAKYPSILMLQN